MSQAAPALPLPPLPSAGVPMASRTSAGIQGLSSAPTLLAQASAPADCAIHVFLQGKCPCFPFHLSALEEFPVTTAGSLPPPPGCPFLAAHLTRLHPKKEPADSE